MKIFENLVHDTYRNFIAANPNAAIRADFIRDRWNNRENTTAFLNEMAFIANYAEFMGKSNEGDEALNAAATARFIDKRVFGTKEERQRVFEEVRLAY